MMSGIGELHSNIDPWLAAFVLPADHLERQDERAEQQESSAMDMFDRHAQNLYPAATPITSLKTVGAFTGDDSMRRYSREKRR